MTVPPTRKGGNAGGGTLALRMGGKEGASQFHAPQAASPVFSAVHSSRTCQFRSTSFPGVSFRKTSSGDTFLAQKSSALLAVGPMFFWGASYVFQEDACRLLQPQEQRLFLFLVLLLIRSKTLGKSLALLEGQFSHW